jgi:hypothetical protein
MTIPENLLNKSDSSSVRLAPPGITYTQRRSARYYPIMNHGLVFRCRGNGLTSGKAPHILNSRWEPESGSVSPIH